MSFRVFLNGVGVVGRRMPARSTAVKLISMHVMLGKRAQQHQAYVVGGADA